MELPKCKLLTLYHTNTIVGGTMNAGKHFNGVWPNNKRLPSKIEIDNRTCCVTNVRSDIYLLKIYCPSQYCADTRIEVRKFSRLPTILLCFLFTRSLNSGLKILVGSGFKPDFITSSKSSNF